MSEEVRMEFHTIIQEAVTKIIPKKKKCKKVKWLSEEALQLAEERKEMKRTGERERYIQAKAELQRIARKYKDTLFNEQCKEKEENKRMGKARDLFKKIGDIKETFHAMMGTIKDRSNKERNSKDIREVEEIKKRWQEYTELDKKDLNEPYNHHSVVTHLEPDILECEAKLVLGSMTMNKANGGDRIPAELFQILKDDAVKVLHSICQQVWKTPQWPQDWGKLIFITIPNKGNVK